MISRGASPGDAVSEALKKGIVDTRRASVVMIPTSMEGTYLPYLDRLLSEQEAYQYFDNLQRVEKSIDNSPGE